MNKYVFSVLLLFIMAACSVKESTEILFPYDENDFKSEIDGRETKLYKMSNKNGMVATFTNYGAKIVSIYVPDKDGVFDDVVLGFNSIADYKKYGASHGAVIGPYANRISNASFVVDGVKYKLPVNNGNACLHSGDNSWYRRVWIGEERENKVIFTIKSRDGDFGFPGNIVAKVFYTLTDQNELRIEYMVTTDKTTHINITNHSYFNLKGEGKGDVLEHRVVINAQKTTPVINSSMIPTGEIRKIKGTALDFITSHAIGERIEQDDEQLIFGNGYDFNYVINKEQNDFGFAASAYEPLSGRYMEVFTTQPGVQFYTGNFLDGKEIGNSGNSYYQRSGFCFETQHFPDSPNQPLFPSTLLREGQVFKSTTVYKFSVKK